MNDIEGRLGNVLERKAAIKCAVKFVLICASPPEIMQFVTNITLLECATY
jgi:hypothetical protein